MNTVSVEFLTSNGFRSVQFPDGWYWLRQYTAGYYLQVDEKRETFTEVDSGWIEELTDQQFVELVNAHDAAIKQN